MKKKEKNIKIIYVITKAIWGGAQKYVFDLATNLPKDKFDVSVIVGGEGLLKEKLLESRIRVIPFSQMKRDINLFKEIQTFFSLLKIFIKEKPDIIHLNSSKAGGLGAFAGRVTGIKKIIFTGHGWAFNEDRGLFSKIVIAILHWLTIILSHKTIAVSQNTKRQIIKKLPFVSKKIVVIHNGFKEQELYSRDEAREFLFQKTNLFGKSVNLWSTKTAWIGTIAELHKNKGIDIAIKTIEKLSQKFKEQKQSLVYFVIGEGEERKNLEKIIKEKKLDAEIFLIGNIENASKYLNAFDVFLLSSRTEALPYVLLESGNARISVVTTNVGGISEIVEDMKTGILVDKNNDTEKISNDFSNALITLLLDSETRNKMGYEAKNKIEKEFSFYEMIKKTIEIYKFKSSK
ncbi:glycosyltransferase [Patescibacteria group bacterium]|nr:glycosyltransferase [Patescibacteria group bacterium]MBU4115595.1 glycosyltransferase [Patescibacteria group bacterium]